MSATTSTFWRDTRERAVKTFAQAEVALLLAQGTGLLNTDWWASLSASGMAVVLSVLSSMASAKGGEPGTASLTSAVVPAVPSGARHADGSPFPAAGVADTAQQQDSGSRSEGNL